MAPPAYKPTDALKRRVSILAGGGWTQEEIAIALGITKPTLLKYYEYELTHGARERRADNIEALYTAASKGNVSAQKAYAQLCTTFSPPPADKPEGKKAQAQADAVAAQSGTSWESLLPSPPVQ